MGGRVAVLTGAAAAAAEAADERFVLEFQIADGAWQRELLVSCSEARFEEALPVRPFRFGKGLRTSRAGGTSPRPGLTSGSSPGWGVIT
jgi:hypothetical protein